MSKKAVIQGEIHIFPTDRKSLMNRDTDQYQALYQEGRDETITPHHQQNRYHLYLIGALTLYLGYGIISYIYTKFPLNSGFDIKAQAKDAGLDFDDEIDLTIHEIFDSYNTQTVNRLLSGLIAVLVLLFLYTLVNDTVSVGVPGIISVSTPIPMWMLTLVFAVLLPFAYFSSLVSYANSGERDIKMASSIMRKCDERGHDSILILVGDKHVEPIGEKLEENGWEVKKERTNNRIAKIKRRLTQKIKLIEALQ